MTSWLYKLSRRCAERGWLVIGIWVFAAVVIIGGDNALGGQSVSSIPLSGTDSASAQQLLGKAFPGASSESNPIVVHNGRLDLGTGPGARQVSDIAAAELALPDVASVTTPVDNPRLLSDDGHTAIVSVQIRDASLRRDEVAEQVLAVAEAAAGDGTQVAAGGIVGAKLSRPSTLYSEVLGLGAALIVLFVTLRRGWAMLIPLANALFAVGIGLAVVSLLGRVVFIPDVAPTLGTMLGLGVGIDYALFLIMRHRNLLYQGYAVPDAMGRTAGTAGAGVVFAGSTLVAAVVGLTFTGLAFLAWLGYAAAIVVTIAVISSITLVPALLGVMGKRILPKQKTDAAPPSQAELDSSRWAALANAVTSKPWTFAIGTTVVLLILAAPTLALKVGMSDAGTLPERTTSRQAYDLLASGFGPGQSAPLAVVVQLYTVADAPDGDATNAPAGTDPRTLDQRLQDLRRDLESVPGVVEVSQPVVSTDGGIAVLRVVPAWSGSDERTEALVDALRESVLPAATAGDGMQAYVGGVTAITSDLYERIADRTVWFIVGVVVLSFLLLMLAYRSLLIPLKAALMNLISIAAAYGVVVAVFHWGWGATLIGLDGPVPIESYVPMMMFAVLFGLSMDYEVFLLTAFREHFDKTGSIPIAVRRGLADTGRLITAAALIMVVVFASFVVSDDPTVKMFGVGLATAVAVDATIVRCGLVPAFMVLAQKGTWWLPGWLDRLLPQLHVEGDPQALSQAAASPAAPSAGRPAILLRPVAVIGAVLGVGAAWILVPALPTIPAESHTPVALSAILAAVALLLPHRPPGQVRLGLRALGFILGILLGLVTVGLLYRFIPPVQASQGAVTSWAIVIIALLTVIMVSRHLAIPMVLGAITTAVAVSTLASSSDDAMLLLSVTLLPALVTFIITGMGIAISGDAEPAPDAAAPPDVMPKMVGPDRDPVGSSATTNQSGQT